MLERRGIVSGYEGSKARKVLIAETDLARILGDGEEPPPSVDEPVRRPDLLARPASAARYAAGRERRLVRRLQASGLLDTLAP